MKRTLCGIIVFGLCGFAAAGSLTPPGPPGPTMKTLDDVEARTPIRNSDLPLVISQPGSYYLAENLTFASGAAIGITASSVIIDLNGFSMDGPGIDAPGITVAISDFNTGTTSHTVVRNGIISGCPNQGINLGGSKSLIENVIVRECGAGILIRSGSIRHCRTEFNKLSGIDFLSGGIQGEGIIENCISNNNGNDGIRANVPRCVIRNNHCFNNAQTGIRVFNFTGGSRVEGNNSTHNNTGITVVGPSLMVKNSAAGNSGIDFNFSNGATVGPIIDMTAGGVIASEHPWANFRY